MRLARLITARRPERIDATVDLSGRYLLPSLIEAHNHDAQSGRFGAISNVKNMRAGMFHSVQLCSRPSQRADCGGFFGQTGMMTVVYAEGCLSASDGHPLGIALASAREAGFEMDPAEARRFYDPVDSLEALDRLWPELLERRPGLIKIILNNSEHRERDSEGAEANLIAFERDPIEDMETLRRPVMRIQRGMLLGG